MRGILYDLNTVFLTYCFSISFLKIIAMRSTQEMFLKETGIIVSERAVVLTCSTSVSLLSYAIIYVLQGNV